MVLCFSSPGKLTQCLPQRGRKLRPREDGCLEPTDTRDRGRVESRLPPHLELQVGAGATPVPSRPLSYLIFLPRWTPSVSSSSSILGSRGTNTSDFSPSSDLVLSVLLLFCFCLFCFPVHLIRFTPEVGPSASSSHPGRFPGGHSRSHGCEDLL